MIGTKRQGGSSHEEIALYDRADRLCIAASRRWHLSAGGLQKDGHYRGDPFGYSQGRLFYRWKKKFQGMGVPELRRLKVLEEENGRLKQLVADL